MGAKPKDVGGGPAVPLGNDLANFFRQGLNTGTFGGNYQPYGQQPPPRTNQLADFGNRMFGGGFGGGQQTATDNFNRADPVGSTQGIAGVLNRNLAGDFGNNEYISQLAGMQFNPTDFSGFNPNINIGDVTQDPRFNALLGGLSGGGGVGIPGYQKANFNLGDVNIDPYKALADRRRQELLAETRARYGAGGGAAFGTPAAFAEANALSEFSAQEAAQMAEIGRAQQGLELERQSRAADIDAKNYGSQVGALASLGGSRMGAASSGLGSLVSLLLGNQGNQLNAQLGQAGLNLDALKAQAGNQFGYDQLRSGNLGQAAGLQNQWGLGTMGMQQDLATNLLSLISGLGGKGISQRQTVMQPSAFQQGLGALTGLAGGAAPFFMPGIGGAAAGLMGQMNQPQLQMPSAFQPQLQGPQVGAPMQGGIRQAPSFFPTSQYGQSPYAQPFNFPQLLNRAY